jgi:hypothetical protein
MKNSRRLIQALVSFGVLLTAAFFLLSGMPRIVVLIVLAGFLAKTVLWHFKPEE